MRHWLQYQVHHGLATPCAVVAVPLSARRLASKVFLLDTNHCNRLLESDFHRIQNVRDIKLISWIKIVS